MLIVTLILIAAACGSGSSKSARLAEYVYVLDSNAGSTDGNQLIVIDPATRTVVTTLPGSYSPDAVVDPTGGRVFVTNGRNPDLVDEYNTSDWTRTGTFTTDKRYYSIIYPVAPDWLKLSPDGKLLYYLKYGTFPDGCGPCNSYIAAVDLQTGEPALNLLVDKCNLGSVDLDPSKPIMYTTCIGSRGGAALLDLNTGVLTSVPVQEDIWSSIRDAGHDKWYLLLRSMRVYVAGTGGAPNDLTVGAAIDLNVDSLRAVQATTTALSPDGSRLYVAAITNADNFGTGRADEIWGFDTQSWERVTRIVLQAPAFHFAVSLDGRTLYAVDYKTPALTFVDIDSGEQTAMPNVGSTPAKVLVGPK